MKGVDALIASVLIIFISVTAIFIALQYGRPSTDKAKEILLMQEGKSNLISIDNAVKNVLSEGEGSARALRITITGGNYVVDNASNSICFTMDSFAQLMGVGISKVEDGINITGYSGLIRLNLTLSEVQLVSGSDFGKGSRTITVRNEGYDPVAERQMIYISPAP